MRLFCCVGRAATSSSMFLIGRFIVVVCYGLLMMMVSAVEQGTFSINRPVVRRQPPDDGLESTSMTTGSVRCFCNLPVCVSTGYMCKSSSGGCFSDLLHQSAPRSVYGGRHGCLELLTDKVQRDWCQPSPNRSIGHKKKSHPKSLLLCCYRDMCNHADSPETTVLLNETDNLLNNISSQIDTLGYNSSEVWFKAATIAVPICGAVILLVLIALAVRILRAESQSNTRHKLGTSYLSSAPNKNNCAKYHDHYQTSHKEPTHQNPVYVNHIEELRQIRTPLLLQNELGRQHVTEKNTNIVMKYLPNHSYADSKTYYSFDLDGKNVECDFADCKNLNFDRGPGGFEGCTKNYDKSKIRDDNVTEQGA